MKNQIQQLFNSLHPLLKRKISVETRRQTERNIHIKNKKNYLARIIYFCRPHISSLSFTTL